MTRSGVEPAVSREELEHVVVGERAANATFAPRDLGRGPESVEHRLLGRVDDCLEHVVEVAVGHVRSRRLSARLTTGRGERDEDLTAAVMPDRAAAREPETGPRKSKSDRRLAVEPDVGVDLTSEQYFASVDPVLERALKGL